MAKLGWLGKKLQFFSFRGGHHESFVLISIQLYNLIWFAFRKVIRKNLISCSSIPYNRTPARQLNVAQPSMPGILFNSSFSGQHSSLFIPSILVHQLRVAWPNRSVAMFFRDVRLASPRLHARGSAQS
jgi:hypothetical protein